jgi:hypothetical protein
MNDSVIQAMLILGAIALVAAMARPRPRTVIRRPPTTPKPNIVPPAQRQRRAAERGGDDDAR